MIFNMMWVWIFNDLRLILNDAPKKTTEKHWKRYKERWNGSRGFSSVRFIYIICYRFIHDSRRKC